MPTPFEDAADYEEYLSLLYSYEAPDDTERLPSPDPGPTVEDAEVPF